MEKGKEITAEQAREISRNPSISDTVTQRKFNEVKERLFYFIEQESKKEQEKQDIFLQIIFVRQIILFHTTISAIWFNHILKVWDTKLNIKKS